MKAIKAKCIECIYDPGGNNGTVFEQVEACTATECPLYPLRPVSKATRDAKKQGRINAMSDSELKAYRRKQNEARKRFAGEPT